MNVRDFGPKSSNINTSLIENKNNLNKFQLSHWKNSKSIIYLIIFSFLNFLFYNSPRRFEIHEVSQSAKAANEEVRKRRLKEKEGIVQHENIEEFRKKM